MKVKNNTLSFKNGQMIFIGLGLAAAYWILESLIYILTSNGIGFFQGMFVVEFREIAVRSLALCFFMIFGSHAQFTMSQRRQAEIALEKSEERYRTIIESIEDGYYEVDIPGNFTFFNDATCKILGTNRDEMIKMNIREALDEENAMRVFDTFNRVHVSEMPNEISCRVARKDAMVKRGRRSNTTCDCASPLAGFVVVEQAVRDNRGGFVAAVDPAPIVVRRVVAEYAVGDPGGRRSE